MEIIGIKGMTLHELKNEIDRGGKFVIYQYCFSILVMTFKRPTDIYFIRAGESALGKSAGWTILTLFAGWWGIPWGPIYTVGSLITNFKGGKNVTNEVLRSIIPSENQQVKPEGA